MQETLGKLSILSDNLEVQIQELKSMIGELERQVIAMREETKLEVLNQLGRALNHEMNQPLTVLLGYIDLLQQGMGQEYPTFEVLGAIRKAADRISRTVRQVRHFQRYVTQPLLDEEIIDIERSTTDEP